MTNAVIALGSNVGDSAKSVMSAAMEIAALPGVNAMRLSKLYSSTALTPDGPDVDAPRFVNAVAIVDTELSANQLLDAVLAVEARHGRLRSEKWASRTLDVDIIAWGDEHIDEPHLTVPHPEAHRRPFVLVPWLEINPEAVLPGAGAVADLLKKCSDSGLTVTVVERS